MHRSFPIAIALLALQVTNGHLAPFHKGMYCLDGNSGKLDLNAAEIVRPLYGLTKSQWWFHHVDQCDLFPPKAGDILEIPAGGEFTIEIAANRAQTTLSYDGKYTSQWADGNTYPDDYNVETCIVSPNMHTQNESMAAGTAFAISYQSDITKVTAENLAVFTVRYHTPWKRLTIYSVPAAMPPCPPQGCICAWGWIPNGCGQPNMYHVPFRCNVTGATSNAPIAPAVPPVWCEGNSSTCTRGAKQMLYWNQLDGSNIQVSGWDLSGGHKSPAYNAKCGFSDGAQNDIFLHTISEVDDGHQNGSNAAASSPAGNTSSPSIPITTGTTPSSGATSTSVQASSGISSNITVPLPSPSTNPKLIYVPGSPGGSCRHRNGRRFLSTTLPSVKGISIPRHYRHNCS